MPKETIAKCTNFGGCSKADAKESVTLAPGADMTCEECGKALAVVGSESKSGGGKGKYLMLVALLLLAAVGGLLFWPGEEEPSPAPVPEPVQTDPQPPAPKPVDPQPADPQPIQPQPVTPQPVTPQPIQPQPITPQPVDPRPVTPQPKPQPPQPVIHRDPQPPVVQPEPMTPTYSGPPSGALIWEGTVSGTELITIQDGVASSGALLSGNLPGVAVLLQPTDEKRVTIAAAPQPADHYKRVVFRVKNNGKTKVTLRWALP